MHVVLESSKEFHAVAKTKLPSSPSTDTVVEGDGWEGTDFPAPVALPPRPTVMSTSGSPVLLDNDKSVLEVGSTQTIGDLAELPYMGG